MDMRRSMQRPKRLILGLAILAVLVTASNAFTASNTIPAQSAGSGSSTISGYTVSAVSYTPNATTPGNIDAVVFTLSAAATTVKAKLVNAETAYYACTNTSGMNWSCATTSPQATVASADSLSVIAVQ
ncbi:MAG: hypothetical protein WDA27_07985 [Actinomycetota bacterium]